MRKLYIESKGSQGLLLHNYTLLFETLATLTLDIFKYDRKKEMHDGATFNLTLEMKDTETDSTTQTHLLSDILKRGRRYNRETDKEDVGLRVAEGSQPVVVLLTCRGETDTNTLINRNCAKDIASNWHYDSCQ